MSLPFKNSLLNKQVKKHLGDVELSESMNSLLESIQKTYEQNKRDRDFLERTMDVSLKENLEINKQLKEDLKLRNKTLENLYDALDVLDSEPENFHQSDNILTIAKRLKTAIQESRKIDEQRKKSEAMVRTVIDSALDAVIVIDDKGLITEWNRQAESTFGWSRDEAIGEILSETIIPSQFQEAHKKGMKHFLTTGEGPVLNQRFEITALRRNGEEFPVELAIVPIKLEDKYIFSSFIRDLTESKKSERALKAINDLARSLLGKTTLEDIAWEITENTIKPLGFDDCVIYIREEGTEYLQQIAAYGKKNPEGREISNSIILKIGEGIVGKAAQSGEVILVNDTSTHADYIVDDEIRLSELAVPIIEQEKVIGVIDTEHHEKDFYTDEHVELLTTVANLASAQIKIALETKKREEVEKSLKESEERWQNLVVNQPEALQISKNGKVIYLNPAGLELYEADSLDQMINFDLLKFADEEMRKKMQQRLKDIMEFGSVDPLEFPIVTLKGNLRFIEANSTKVLYNGNVAVQTILRDITEKKVREKELKEISSRLSTLLDHLSSGVLMESIEREVIHSNQKFSALFGNVFTPESIQGANCATLLSNAKHAFKNPEAFADRVSKLVNERKTVLQEELELADGRTFERDYIAIYTDGVFSGNVWQYRDITEKKKAELELVRALESERSYNELNSNFVSMVSHEFRTPLTSIHSTSELLMQFGDRFQGEELKKRVERIYNSSIKMDSLIQDVLTIGKLDSENTFKDLRTFCFRNILDEMINTLSATVLKDREVIVTGEEVKKEVTLDANLVDFILRNLLENAGKYSSEPDKILFDYNISQDYLSMKCTDFGIGIPEKDQSTIFESFKRGSNTENIKGTGLGLPIVKKSVERMGGEIDLDSTEGVGTTITVKIPLQNNLNNE